MDTSRLESDFKWEEPDDPTKFELRYPLARAPRNVWHWDRWLAAMMLDTRLNSTDRVILTALASHYNLKTGECCPSLRRVAVEAGIGGNKETGTRAVRDTLKRAAEFGWIKRTFRHGGPRRNQTNLYELRLPDSITKCREIGLSVTGEPGAWQVFQVTDGAVVCGSFKERANAESWIEEHGPSSVPTGENRPPDRGIDPSITENLKNIDKREEAGERALRARETSESPLPDPLVTPEGRELVEKHRQEWLRRVRLQSMPRAVAPRRDDGHHARIRDDLERRRYLNDRRDK